MLTEGTLIKVLPQCYSAFSLKFTLSNVHIHKIQVTLSKLAFSSITTLCVCGKKNKNLLANLTALSINQLKTFSIMIMHNYTVLTQP